MSVNVPAGDGSGEGELTPADGPEPGGTPVAEPTGSTAERWRRIADEIAANLLPSTTNDERDDWAERRSADSSQWLKENRPPHHDR